MTTAQFQPAPESALRTRQVTDYERQNDDWYVEPYWCVRSLIMAEPFVGKVWDPSCGLGTIPQTFKNAGFDVIATDLRYRGYGTGGQDFLAFDRRHVGATDNIACNPPFKHALPFLRQAKRFTTRKVAFLLPLKWLSSRKRFNMFRDEWRPSAVYVLSDRISMPPGEYIDPLTRKFNCDDPNPKAKEDGSLKHRWRKGDEPSGGAVDFCWVVWDHEANNEKPGTTKTGWISKEGVLP